MRFKKRYLLLLIPGLLIGAMRLEFFAFRKNQSAQTKYLEEKGQSRPHFHTYQFGNQNMHYTHVGDADKPLLILVHGAPGSSSAMLDYLADKHLKDAFQIVAVDRPGYGYSDYGETEVDLEKQSAAILAILDRHPASKTILMGHSFGGPVIARMAMDAPDRIDGLCMVAGSIDPELEPREWWRKPVDWPIIRSLLPKSLMVCNQEIIFLYDELNRMMPLWENIICPVVIFQGKKDKLVPPGNADFAEQMLQNSVSVDIRMIDGGNHFILWSMQNEICQAMIELIEN